MRPIAIDAPDGPPLTLLVAEAMARGAVVHGFTTRRGGFSAPPFEGLNLGEGTGDDPRVVERNRGRLLAALGLAGPLASTRQAHGSQVARVGEGGLPVQGVATLDADAIWTTEPGLPVCVRVADCVPVLLWAEDVGAVAAVHAGWRGTALGVVRAAVRALAVGAGADPRHMRAAIGPAISADRYPVGPDVREALQRVQPPGDRGWMVAPEPGGGARVDLAAANASQIEAEGVPPASIDRAGICTASNPDLLYSYRRDGPRSGRQLGVIALPAK